MQRCFQHNNNMASPMSSASADDSNAKGFWSGTKKRRRSDASGHTDTSDDDACNCSPDEVLSTSDSVTASNLSREDLASLGIFYAKEPSSLNSFFDKLKSRKTSVTYPKCLSLFEALTKKMLTFSADMSYVDSPRHLKRSRLAYLATILPEIDQNLSKLNDLFVTCGTLDMKKDIMTQAGVNKNNKEQFLKCFSSWTCTWAPRFLKACKSIMSDLASIESLSRSDRHFTQLPESIFTNLVKYFTEMMFLTPSYNVYYESEMDIKGKRISGVPDVLFQEQNDSGGQAGAVLMVIEVNRSEILTPKVDKDESWIGNRFTKEVLGRIGTDLLVKWTISTFRPGALGILCMGTEIMFVFLDMKNEHGSRIELNKDIRGDHAEIQYTKTFDIMKAEDRAEVCPVLLWLANVQSCYF